MHVPLDPVIAHVDTQGILIEGFAGSLDDRHFEDSSAYQVDAAVQDRSPERLPAALETAISALTAPSASARVRSSRAR